MEKNIARYTGRRTRHGWRNTLAKHGRKGLASCGDMGKAGFFRVELFGKIGRREDQFIFAVGRNPNSPSWH
jgi:hypothetical protein